MTALARVPWKLPKPVRQEIKSSSKSFVQLVKNGQVSMPDGSPLTITKYAEPVVEYLIQVGVRMGWKSAIRHYEVVE